MKPLATLLCAYLFLCAAERVHAQIDAELQRDVEAAMAAATSAFHDRYATNGGHVYYYSPDGQKRLGEGPASPTQIWVQSPGTPTVGLAYLKAYEATGDEAYLQYATQAAEALIFGQLESGAWTNSVDFDPAGSPARYRNGKGGDSDAFNFSTLDDGISQEAIRFLSLADRAHNFQHNQIHEAVTIALNALLDAQFDNGAFPQGWDEADIPPQPILEASYPDYDWRSEGRIKEYWHMYTLNDGVAGDVAKTLLTAWEVYQDRRYFDALLRLGDFLVLAQMPYPQPAWAQQYNYQMHPIWARAFEPAAISGRESQDAMRTLLLIYEISGNTSYLKPVPRAIAYLRNSELPDGKLARFYELKTNRPLYVNRNGSEYTLTYDDSGLPRHYRWKADNHLDEIEAAFRDAGQSTDRTSPVIEADRENDIRDILEAMDANSLWVSRFNGERLTGQPSFQPGEEYISSLVFSDNLTALAEYLIDAKK